MVVNRFKNWISKCYAKPEVEKDEIEAAMTVSSNKKTAFEKELSRYDLENLMIDYEGIVKILFEGDMVYASTKEETYTIRLHTHEKYFQFLKNLMIPDSSHALIDRVQWILTTPIQTHVKRANLPKLNFLYIDESPFARIHIDMKKEVDLRVIRSIVDALHGKVNSDVDDDHANSTLAYLRKEIYTWNEHEFSIKMNATDLQAITFYAETRTGQKYALRNVGSFPIQTILIDPQAFLRVLKKNVTPTLQRLFVRIKEMEFQNQLDTLSIDVKLIHGEHRPAFTCARAVDPIFVQANEITTYSDALTQIDRFKQRLIQEPQPIKESLERLMICLEADSPYSIEGNYVQLQSMETHYDALVSELITLESSSAHTRWNQWIERETPTLRKVLKNLVLSTELDEPFCLKSGKVSIYLNRKDYRHLLSMIREILKELANFETSETYIGLRYNIDTSLFGVSYTFEKKQSIHGDLLVVTIQKTNEEPYQRIFDKGILIPDHLLENMKIKNKEFV